MFVFTEINCAALDLVKYIRTLGEHDRIVYSWVCMYVCAHVCVRMCVCVWVIQCIFFVCMYLWIKIRTGAHFHTHLYRHAHTHNPAYLSSNSHEVRPSQVDIYYFTEMKVKIAWKKSKMYRKLIWHLIHLNVDTTNRFQHLYKYS